MTPVGIVIALKSEVRTFTSSMPPAGMVTQQSSGEFVILSGIGAGRARDAGQRLLERGATALLSWGTAAGLDPRLRPGAIVLPLTIVTADGARIGVTSRWHERVYRCLVDKLPVSVAALAESRTVLTERAAKIALAQRRGAGAADMESASIAQVAQGAGVPFLVVRAVADSAAIGVPAWLLQGLDAWGKSPVEALCKGLLRNPWDLVTLLRLGRAFQAARTALSQVKAQAGAELQQPL